MTTSDKVIKNKLGLLNLAEQLGNVSQACKIFGYSRDSFYRFKELYEQGGDLALQELSRKQPNKKNRVSPEIERAVVALAVENPALGQLRASNELKQEGTFVSPGSTWRALRNTCGALGSTVGPLGVTFWALGNTFGVPGNACGGSGSALPWHGYVASPRPGHRPGAGAGRVLVSSTRN